ncbi:MAG: transglutaminase domain-containing protein, partial [Tetragenococcus koreensis]|nr:transglutaminase domain-containing protein [Tetragenococcus koreensis]
MPKRIYNKAIPIILTFFTFSIAFYQLLKIYHMENQLNVNIVVIALLCLIAGIIPRWFLKIPFYFLVLYSGLFFNFPQNLSFSLKWGAVFWERLVHLNGLFIAGSIGYLPEEIAVSLVFFVMILLIELIIEYER